MNSSESEAKTENTPYLTEQLITYIGNKRALLDFIGQGVSFVKKRLGVSKLTSFDVFSGSGIVSRYLKQHSSYLYANDLEQYAHIISSCYLSNEHDIDTSRLNQLHRVLIQKSAEQIDDFVLETQNKQGVLCSSFKDTIALPGFISELYAPRTMARVKKEERCFYTPYNACCIDILRQNIATLIPAEFQQFFIAPLLAECSVHANTGGIFKGFYKNSKTGTGKFGGNGADALSRITGHITLPFPVFSSFSCNSKLFCEDANTLVQSNHAPHVDFAYIDPPYNQHPYGSNYFMLNLVADYMRPDDAMLSTISGIPKDWHRSRYNCRSKAAETFLDLVQHIDAKYLAVSFNNEGFISEKEMIRLLSSVGKVTVLESPYTAFRASRNLSGRSIHVKEFLYIVEK
jgi:adenine-specific DNA-methyltransferase